MVGDRIKLHLGCVSARPRSARRWLTSRFIILRIYFSSTHGNGRNAGVKDDPIIRNENTQLCWY